MRVVPPTLIAIMCMAFPTAHAAVSLSITEITSTTMTFTLTGNISGSTPTLFSDRLVFEDAGNGDWITGPSGGSGDSSGPLFAPAYLSADPLSAAASQGSIFFNDNAAGNEDTIILDYGANLTAADSGTGASVTVTLPGSWSFNPENITEIALSWGINNTSDEPYSGTFQSSTAIPEPSVTLLGALGVLLLLRRRR